jgi:hypothetical protein
MLFETALLLEFLHHARGRRAVRSSLAAEWSEMSERHRQGGPGSWLARSGCT